MAQTVHVYPVNDVIDHDSDSDNCVCGPDVEAVPAVDGSMGWLISHHALDGREFCEPDYVGPSMPAGIDGADCD